MKPLPRRRFAEELLDRGGHDPDVLLRSLRHVAAVNRWLGGRRALLRHLGGWIQGGATRILDVGTGIGDLPKAVERWARRHNRNVAVTAVDSHVQVASLASAALGIPVPVADGLRLPFRDQAFHVSLLSLTLHHTEGLDQIRILRELARVSSRHVLVGELHRTWPNYCGSRLLASTWWRGNPLTRHDGPLSVLRAFTPAELMSLANDAGLRRPRVYRHVFYRLVLTAEV